MNIQHVVLFCFSSALCGGNTGLVSAKLNIYTGAEGGTGSISCHLTLTGNMKFFCRNECKGEDILIRTDDVTAQNGRYSIAYSNGSSGIGILTVTITRLTKSDAGRYRCGLGKTLGSYLYQDFGLRVSDVGLLDVESGFHYTKTEGEEVTQGCGNSAYRSWKFFCKDECKKQDDVLIETDGNRTQSGRYSIEYTEGSPYELRVTISQVTKLDTGRYRCGYGRAFSPEVYVLFPIIVIDAPTTSSPNWSPPPSSASVPSAPTPITSSSAGSFTPSPVFPATTNQLTMYIFPLVVCVLMVAVLSALVMLLLYKQKTMTSNGTNVECVTYENHPPASTYQDSVYQSLDPASRDHDQIYAIQHETV
ncbi:polymeric immunoglobulin receptor-like isoform X1 [Epinephelus fuscoguttatus]|uniref:polymeric immunoglobulin receptor-like isoform X1 n=2 Tax=Epinephelus fuscoguttatus TaxID=293821 RepID=UPI0020D03919|nr:polymeric immunoglobulin receptor-like isoform X1 [Epinephelus fuscoguttatus]